MAPEIPSGLEWISMPDMQFSELVALAAKDFPLPPKIQAAVDGLRRRRRRSGGKRKLGKSKNRHID